LDEFLCKINPAACLPEPQLTPNGGGEVLNVNAGSVEAVADPTTGTVMAKGSGKGVGQRIKEGVESAVTNLCKGLLAIICGGAGAKAAEEVSKDGDPTNEVTTAVNTVRAFSYSAKSLQHAFSRHASQLGFQGNWSRENAARFGEFLTNHVRNAGTQAIQGGYRDMTNVIHYYNSASGINVITDANGNLIAAFKLSEAQIRYLTTTGVIK
jgi:hypothetical protein